MSATTQQEHFAPPDLEDVRSGLARVIGDRFEGIWTSACLQANIGPAAMTIEDDQFEHLLEAIADQDPLCRVLAMSWKIRRTAANKLAELGR